MLAQQPHLLEDDLGAGATSSQAASISLRCRRRPRPARESNPPMARSARVPDRPSGLAHTPDHSLHRRPAQAVLPDDWLTAQGRAFSFAQVSPEDHTSEEHRTDDRRCCTTNSAHTDTRRNRWTTGCRASRMPTRGARLRPPPASGSDVPRAASLAFIGQTARSANVPCDPRRNRPSPGHQADLRWTRDPSLVELSRMDIAPAAARSRGVVVSRLCAAEVFLHWQRGGRRATTPGAHASPLPG